MTWTGPQVGVIHLPYVPLRTAVTQKKGIPPLDGVVFLVNIETGACLLRVEVVMPHNQCRGEHLAQFAQQCQHRPFLFHGPGILWMPPRIQSPFITDPYRVGIVVLTVSSCLEHIPAVVYLAVAGDVEVVTDVAEVPVPYMVSPAVFKAQTTAIGRSRAVKDNHRDDSHVSLSLSHSATLQSERRGYRRQDAYRSLDDEFQQLFL